jgi:hypothetical protein
VIVRNFGEVGILERAQFLMAERLEVTGAQPRALLGEPPFKQVSDLARIAEVPPLAAFEDLRDRSTAVPVGDAHARLLHHLVEDLSELIFGEVREVDDVGHAAVEPGVEMKELAHLVCVAGQDDDQLITQVLRHLQEGFDGLLPESVVLAVHETVGLVDEQHPAARALDNLGGLRRRLALVLGDELLARDFH